MAGMGSWHGEPCLEVKGKRFVALAGELHNSSSSDEAAMEAAWQKAEVLGMNTLAVPVSWELLEPEEGVFDFSQADSLIAQARRHKGHLILLWFGTWKNARASMRRSGSSATWSASGGRSLRVARGRSCLSATIPPMGPSAPSATRPAEPMQELSPS